MTYWFTADTHFGHFNIIRYTGRPFKTVEQMNETLIANWNNRVARDDVVFFLGDFCFKSKQMPSELEAKLNGHIIFLKGNHDNENSKSTPIERIIISYAGKRILLIHNPAHITAEDKYDLIFCGHVHEKWKESKYYGNRVINVGVDVRGFAPVTFEELVSGY